jgi:hypothetical protein
MAKAKAKAGKIPKPAPNKGRSGSKKTPTERPSPSNAVDLLISEIDALANSLPLVMPLLVVAHQEAVQKWEAFLKDRCKPLSGGRSNVPPEAVSEFFKVLRNLRRGTKAIQIISKKFLDVSCKSLRLLPWQPHTKPLLYEAGAAEFLRTQIYLLGN